MENGFIKTFYLDVHWIDEFDFSIGCELTPISGVLAAWPASERAEQGEGREVRVAKKWKPLQRTTAYVSEG